MMRRQSTTIPPIRRVTQRGEGKGIEDTGRARREVYHILRLPLSVGIAHGGQYAREDVVKEGRKHDIGGGRKEGRDGKPDQSSNTEEIRLAVLHLGWWED
jgi:hypothetical protein